MTPDMTAPRKLLIDAVQRVKKDLINSLETGDRAYVSQDSLLREYQNLQRAVDVLGAPDLRID